MGTNEENIIDNLVCFIYGGAGACPLHRLRLRNTGYRYRYSFSSTKQEPDPPPGKKGRIQNAGTGTYISAAEPEPVEPKLF